MVYITGFSGRFPSSESIGSFWSNLCDGVDLVTENSSRYPEGYAGLPSRQAQIGTIQKFDAMFFGISSAQASCLDPQLRVLLEVVYEAISDAGYTMEDLARSSTGVYVGGCFSDMHKALLKDVRTITGYENTGCSHSMFANRISFCFDFTGPSLTIDTACSSSLVAMDIAARDVMSGKVSRAIVAGVSIATDPGVFKSFASYGMLSPDGKCHSFDDRANGYVRADGVGAVLLEAPSVCSDVGIMRILGTGSNSDGCKSKGITYPDSNQQIALCQSVCTEFNIDPSKVVYVEAHGTGTVAGDGQELRAIDTAYGTVKTRGNTLIGSVKSNMGHAEGASGMMSLIKVLGIVCEGTVPTNLHYQGTTLHEPIISDRLRVANFTQPLPTATTSGEPPLIAINNFGFGGTNAHMVVCSGGRPVVDDVSTTRFIFGRSEGALQAYHSSGNLNLAAWQVLMRSSTATNKFPWRGVVSADGKELTTSSVPATKPLVAFCYTGQGCQWKGMATELWQDNSNTTFRSTITEACSELPVNVDDLFTLGDKWMNKQWSGFGITLVQLGLTAMLKESGVEPDFIFGHSVGEVACGYADGCTSAKEAARIAFMRCQLSDKIKATGLMLAVGLTYDSAVELIKPYSDTVIACHNSPDGVTLSGSDSEISEIASALQEKGIFARTVPTDGIAYHSKFFRDNADKIEDILSSVITDTPPVERTKRWLSSSCVECRNGVDHDCEKYANAAYHTRNIIGQVNFDPVVRSLPVGTVIVEVGPHALLKSVIKRCRAAVDDGDVCILETMRRGTSGVDTMRTLVDNLWLHGVHFNFPRVTHMVPMKHRVNLQWDHDTDWRIPTFEDFDRSSANSSITIKFDLAGKDAFLMDHIIDGRSLLPATAHVYSAWSAYGTDEIHFVDVKIFSAIILDGVSVSLVVTTDEKGWKIHHDDKLVSQGSIASEYQIPSHSIDRTESASTEDSVWIDRDAVYARLARFGYEYGEHFQSIEKRSFDGTKVQLRQASHWIVYLDNILQAFLNRPTGLSLPTAIGAVSINCKNVKDADHLLISNRDLRSFGNKDVVIRGLKTTLARKVHKQPTIRGVEFVPYGGHVLEHEEQFKQQLMQCLSARDSTGSVTDDLENVVPTKSIRLYVESVHADVLKSTSSSTVPRYSDQLYSSDPILSCQWCTDGLDIISQIIRENLSRSYSVVHVGDSTGVDALYKVMSPMIEHEMLSYSYQNSSVAITAENIDVIISSNALYSTPDISSYLSAMHSALTEDGFLVLREYIGALPQLLWGSVVDCSSVDDERPHGRWLSQDKWVDMLTDAGFSSVIWYTDKSSSMLVLLARKAETDVLADPRATVKTYNEISSGVPSTVLTSDVGYLGMVRSLRKEPGYTSVQLDLDISSVMGHQPVISTQSSDIVPELPMSIRCNGTPGGFHQVPLRQKPDVKNRGYHLKVTKPGDLESLTWVENDVEPDCEVKFCGINFKDVMLSYGKLTSNEDVKIGLEFSGVVAGKPVMGIASGCMASHIKTTDHLLWDIPASLSLEDACTIPVVYSTVYYALVVKANIRRGQTVLIHSIAGGVGQAAFHICKFRGVNVIATCSHAKMEWVHANLGIDKRCILDSHSVKFRDDVLCLTEGRGVDAVLNSLSGDKLQAGLDCVAQYGHFCEIGKYDIQQNMRIGMGVFERNVSIHGFDLSDMFSKPQLWQPVRELMIEGLKSGEVKPLCSTVFEDTEQALRYVSTGKHIGKVIVRVDQSKIFGRDSEAVPKVSRTFRTRGTHLVVGGLGGFGMELVLFLQSRGAERIIIASRSDPKPHQRLTLGEVTVTHADLRDPQQCEEFISSVGENLVGVWHLGMVLNDRLFDKLSENDWNETVRVKADMCKNLDASTRAHCPSLENFVMWSSVSALFGNPGQTNYAYANSAMEGVCMARRAVGLPGVAIQWGFIGTVGVLMKQQATNTSLGFSPQHIDSCLESLNTILFSDHAVASCYIRSKSDSSGEESGAKTLSTSQRIARVLGLDPAKISSTDMLSTLGMDSLQSVEVSNVLKAAGQVKPLDELRFMTWTEILSFD